MSKQKFTLDNFSITKPVSAANEIQQAIKTIHTPKTPIEVKEETTKISITTPLSVYMKVKEFSMREKSTLKDYILNLIINDIEQKSK